MLRALIESAARFSELPPNWYRLRKIRWVVEVDQDGCNGWLTGPLEIEKAVPETDRSSDIKPGFLVDKAEYALGLTDDREIKNSRQHEAFVALLRKYQKTGSDPGVGCIVHLLDRLTSNMEGMKDLRETICKQVKPSDLVAFKTEAKAFPFELASAVAFWSRHVAFGRPFRTATCCVCGKEGPIVLVIPQALSFARQRCKISSFNRTAFDSFGRKQNDNSPLCFDCALQSTRVLQYLVEGERHHRAITRDESRGDSKSPLRNQWAVFWLKKDLALDDGGEPIDVEALMAAPLGSGAAGPPADPGQMGRLYGLPFSQKANALHLDQNRFYVAVISPNKSRLVLREWIDESVSHVIECIQRYDSARTIQTADGADEWRPSIPEMLASLNPPKSRSSSGDANLVRSLLRTAYRGAPPPDKLLETAVLRFRVPDRATDKREEEELRNRRQTLAAAIKFVLTYGKKEAVTLQTLDPEQRTGPHLCGQLLAILEEAQLRASRWRVQATLVDRYYGGASTSPKSTLSVLINQATKAHMPKIRKTGAGYRDLEEHLENVLDSILELGGFPASLTLHQQGDFALGFYHQRACFRAARPITKPDPSATETPNQEKINDSL